MSAKYFETFELKSTWILISKSDFYIFSSYSPMLTSIVTFLWQAKSKDCTKTSFHLSKQKNTTFRRTDFFPSGSHHFVADSHRCGLDFRFRGCPAPESGDFVLAPVSSRFLAPEGERLPPESFLPKHEMMIESMLDNLRMTWQTSKGEWLLGGWTIHLTLQNPIRSSLWYIYIYLLLHTNPPNVGKYTIHGSYGNGPSN